MQIINLLSDDRHYYVTIPTSKLLSNIRTNTSDVSLTDITHNYSELQNTIWWFKSYLIPIA